MGYVRLPGSPLQPPGEKAYFISLVCAGLLAVQSERSAGAQLEPFSTSGLVQQPFFSSGLPWPFHLRGGRERKRKARVRIKEREREGGAKCVRTRHDARTVDAPLTSAAS